MGEAQKLTLDKIISINIACSIIGDNEALDGTTAYRVAKLAGYTESHVKDYNKQLTRINKDFEEKTKGKSPEEKKEVEESRTEQIRALLEEEEEIKIPELKLSMFTAKKKMKVGDREYEEGQLLVPQKFLTLMGEEIIKE